MTPTAQPPEGELLEATLRRNRLSQRRAAEMAGISPARWRQIAKGYQSVSGQYIPVTAPPDTLARMARAAGVLADDLEQAGRGDAATELRAMSDADMATVTEGLPDAQIRAILAILDTLPNASEREEALAEAARQVRHRPDT